MIQSRFLAMDFFDLLDNDPMPGIPIRLLANHCIEQGISPFDLLLILNRLHSISLKLKSNNAQDYVHQLRLTLAKRSSKHQYIHEP
jgi:hypothetical protein